MSSLAPYPHRTNHADGYSLHFLCLGGNGADLTVQQGDGATVVRGGEGVYTLKLTTNPGTFKGAHFDLGAATPANLAGYTVVRDTPTAWNGTTWELPFTVSNGSNAAADLIADEYIDITLTFGALSDL